MTTCRSCAAAVGVVAVDLGMTPLANAFLRFEQLSAMEPFFPLQARVCERCHLLQLAEVATPETIFADYPYFSSWSTSWVDHAARFVDQAIRRCGLGTDSLVVELASNDGYLLQHLVARGVPVLGVEPADNVAEVARDRGVPTLAAFFGSKLGDELAADRTADLVVANNVLAHVPELHDFVAGIARVLAPEGWVSIEVPHVLRLVEDRQFDTIYHEHFSYFSLAVVSRVLAEHGLEVVDVEELPTHGGSLRIWARRAGVGRVARSVADVLDRERLAELDRTETYLAFGAAVVQEKLAILETFIRLRREGRSIAGWGAAAKGNTLLNYCGLGPEMVSFIVDRSPHKQGRFTPGTHIPVVGEDVLRSERPDVVFVLPWNLSEEIRAQAAWISDWGGRFLVRSPDLALLP